MGEPAGPPLTVAIDATPLLGARTGVGHATAALLDALADRGEELELRAYALTWTGRRTLAELLPAGVVATTRRFPARVARAMWRRVDRPRIEHWTGSIDVVHATNFVAPPADAPTVVTVHDLTCVRYPELCTRDTLEYPHLIRRALSRGATVHVVSDTIGAEVRDTFSLGKDRVVRVYPGLMPLPRGEAASGRRIAGCERYVLALGTIEPRKRFDALVHAFDDVATRDDTLGLILAGADGWGSDRVHEAIASARASDRIHTLGYVDDTSRAHLLAGATAFAYPSIYEGFGHPPLEAMSAGIPVLATRAGSLPEVLGDAALLVDPDDDEALTAGLVQILEDTTTRARLASAGSARVARYSWTTTADEMRSLYRRIAA